MGRTPCCEKTAVKRGPWSKEEDQILINYINKYGHENWRLIPKNAGLMRCGKSCRLRWMNYLRPDIKRGHFTREEEFVIVTLHKTFGNRWALIAAKLPGRTDNEIKNIWHTRLKKRLHEFDIPADNQVAGTLKNDSAATNFEGAPAENNDPATNNIVPPHSSSSFPAGAAAAPNNPSGGSAGLRDGVQFWTQINDRHENDKSGFEFNGADINPTKMDNDDNVGGVDPGSLQFWQDHLLTWTDDEFLDLWNSL